MHSSFAIPIDDNLKTSFPFHTVTISVENFTILLSCLTIRNYYKMFFLYIKSTHVCSKSILMRLRRILMRLKRILVRLKSMAMFLTHTIKMLLGLHNRTAFIALQPRVSDSKYFRGISHRNWLCSPFRGCYQSWAIFKSVTIPPRKTAQFPFKHRIYIASPRAIFHGCQSDQETHLISKETPASSNRTIPVDNEPKTLPEGMET